MPSTWGWYIRTSAHFVNDSQRTENIGGRGWD